MTARNRSTRLDITDMPRDKERALGTLRQTLAASFNYCRRYPNKMAILGAVLEYTLTRVKEWQKEYHTDADGKALGSIQSLARPKAKPTVKIPNKKYVAPKAPQEVSNVASNSGNKQSPEPKKIVQHKDAKLKGTVGPDGEEGAIGPSGHEAGVSAPTNKPANKGT